MVERSGESRRPVGTGGRDVDVESMTGMFGRLGNG